MKTLLPILLAGGALLASVPAQAVEIRHRAVVEGPEPGPSVAVLVPGTAYTATHSIARQLSAFEIPRGTMTIIEFVGDTITMEQAAEAVASAEPLFTLVFTNDAESANSRDRLLAPAASASQPPVALGWISAAVSDSFADGLPEIEVEEADAAGLLWVRYSASDVPESRRWRWTRNIVFKALSAGSMAPPRAQLVSVLHPGGPAFALYDAEGVGGGGPNMLQRILRDSGIGMAATPVCGEDVRDGALALGFEGALFPGGSGRGIANGLREEGQELVRQFVQAGGGYVGICAGSYLASCRIDGYLRMAGAYHGQPWAKGSGEVEVELTPEGIAILGEEFARFSTRYNNGPIFRHEDGLVPEGDFAPLVPLGNFLTAGVRRGEPSEEMIGEAAILVTTFGEGRLMLISPHPESHAELNPLMRRALEWSVRRDAATVEATETAAAR